MKTVTMCVVLLSSFGAAAQEPKQQQQQPGATPGATPAPAATGADRQAILADMKKTWGFVPGFMNALPDAALPGAWEQMKTLELGTNTALPPKYKELIGLAVASQIPCTYCIYAHSEFAKANGASEQELGTAVSEAAVTRQWSTWLNGAQIDEARFRADLAKMTTHTKQAMAPGAQPPPAGELTSAESTTKDVEQQMGVMPEFMKRYPKVALPGAWRLMRDVEMNPKGAVPPKYTVLAGLAVASQVPCHYCIVADTELAKAMGATDAEITETVALAAYTRMMSTLLNGMQYDYAAFKQDVAKLTKPKGKKTASLP